MKREEQIQYFALSSQRDQVISLYFNPLTRLVGVFYVTPDHLHRKPTARNITPRDFRAHLFVYSLYPAYVRTWNWSYVRIGLWNQCLAVLRKHRLCLATAFSTDQNHRGLCEINVQNFHNKSENSSALAFHRDRESRADTHPILSPPKAEATDL